MYLELKDLVVNDDADDRDFDELCYEMGFDAAGSLAPQPWEVLDFD